MYMNYSATCVAVLSTKLLPNKPSLSLVTYPRIMPGIFSMNLRNDHLLMSDIWWDSKVVAQSHQVKRRNSVSDVTVPAFAAGMAPMQLDVSDLGS